VPGSYFFWFFGFCAWTKERRKRNAEKRRRTAEEIRCIKKHSVIDVSDSTIFTTKNKENVELLIFTPDWKV